MTSKRILPVKDNTAGANDTSGADDASAEASSSHEQPTHSLAGAALAVVLIMAVVLGVLFPVFGLSRSTAEQQSCASNEKHLGVAILQYAQDYDEVLPNRGRGPMGGYPSWKTDILPYLGDNTTTVFRCPSNPERANTDFDERRPVSYSANRGNGEDEPFVDPTDRLASVSLRSITEPSETIGIVESTSQCTDINITNPQMYAQSTSSGTSGNLFAGHGGRSNFLLIDGHVRAMNPMDTLDRADGGLGIINMWTNDHRSFTELRYGITSSKEKSLPGDATGRTVLDYSCRTYGVKP